MILFPVYDSLIMTRGTYAATLGDFFTSEGRASTYMYSGAQIGDTDNVKRIDAIFVPVRFLA